MIKKEADRRHKLELEVEKIEKIGFTDRIRQIGKFVV